MEIDDTLESSQMLDDLSYKRVNLEHAETVARVAVGIDSVIREFLMTDDYKSVLEDARNRLLNHAKLLSTFCK